MSNVRQTRVAEANKKLAKAITRAQSSLVSECQSILDATVGQSPTGAADSPSTSAGRSRTSSLGLTGGKIFLCCMRPAFSADC